MGKDDNEKEYEELCIMCDDVIKGYQVNEKIDEGNFGQVFKVSKNGKKYAMKVEPNRLDGGSSAIKVEIEILADLQQRNVNFVPRFIGGGKEIKYHWVVMDLLGDNLKKLRFKCQDPNACSPGTWSRIGIQCLYVMKSFHDSGYVHRDLKPANFAMGPPDTIGCRVLHLLDFGISRKYVLRKGSITTTMTTTTETSAKRDDFEFRLARRRTHSFKGTPVYASPNAHVFVDLGRVDDLWSLMYLIAELVQPLPWTLLENEELEKSKKASKLKDLFKNDAFDAVEEMLRKCNYYSFPNYELVFKALKTVFDKAHRSWIDPYDWETEQLASYQKWKKQAESRVALFPWENADPSAFFRHDPWHSLLKTKFLTSKEAASEKKKKKKKKKKDGEALTAEAIEDTKVPSNKSKKSRKSKKDRNKATYPISIPAGPGHQISLPSRTPPPNASNPRKATNHPTAAAASAPTPIPVSTPVQQAALSSKPPPKPRNTSLPRAHRSTHQPLPPAPTHPPGQPLINLPVNPPINASTRTKSKPQPHVSVPIHVPTHPPAAHPAVVVAAAPAPTRPPAHPPAPSK